MNIGEIIQTIATWQRAVCVTTGVVCTLLVSHCASSPPPVEDVCPRVQALVDTVASLDVDPAIENWLCATGQSCAPKVCWCGVCLPTTPLSPPAGAPTPEEP